MIKNNNAMDLLRGLTVVFLLFATQGKKTAADERIQSACEFKLNQCIESLKIISDRSKAFIAFDKDELDSVCKTLPQHLQCINDYAKECFSEQQKKTVNESMTLSMVLFNELCKEGPYQRDYLKHAPCFKDKCEEHHVRVLHESLNTEMSTETQEIVASRFCCAYNDYIQCVTRETLAACSEEASNFVENYLLQTAKPLVQGCSNFSEGSQRCSASIPSTGFLTSVVALIGVFVGGAVLSKSH